MKPHAPACERNRDPILAVLRQYFGDRRHVLEIGSGTGQHAVHFAAAMPWLRWQASDHPDHLAGIAQWLDEAGLANTPPPIALQARVDPPAGLQPAPPLPEGGYDAVFSANTLHIMGWPQVQALFAGLPTVTSARALLAIYGPFNHDGRYDSDSNRQFDDWLQARDPVSAIRDAEQVDALAARAGFGLIADIAMPANNRCLLWRRGGRRHASAR